MFDLDAAIELDRHYTGLATAQLNRDGPTELVLFGETVTLWRWTAQGPVDVTPLRLPNTDPILEVIAADFYGQGQDQLLIRQARQAYLWARSVQGEFRCGTIPIPLPAGLTIWDRRGTGRYGLIAGSRCFELDQRRLIERHDLLPTDRVANLLGAAPLRGGGRADLLVQMTAGTLGCFLNQGASGFENQSAEWGFHKIESAAGPWALVDSGRPEQAGLLLSDPERGQQLIWPEAAGLGSYRVRTPPALAWPFTAPVANVIVQDFDQDGWEEGFLVGPGDTGRLYRFPDGRPIDAGAAARPAQAALCLDLDHDGELELVTLETEPGGPSLCRIYKPRTCGPMLRVDVRTRFGGLARGSLVTVETNRLDGSSPSFPGPLYRQMTRRLVAPGDGVAHFGFQPDETPRRLLIARPDGSRRGLPLDGTTQSLITIQDGPASPGTIR